MDVWVFYRIVDVDTVLVCCVLVRPTAQDKTGIARSLSLIRSLTVTPAFTLGRNYPGHTVFLSENLTSKAEIKFVINV